MLDEKPGLMDAVRERFAHVAACPYQGPRIFFENAGGALTLKSVVERSAEMAAIPDNAGRMNPAGQGLLEAIHQGKTDALRFFNASSGQVFAGESGTELLFRIISNAILETEPGDVLGTSLEHPATRSACTRWAKIAGKRYIQVPHNNETGGVTAEEYAAHVTPKTRVATIIHTSPVTGMGVDVKSVAQAIRAVAPDCLIVIDGIQHAAHGNINIDDYKIDAYVISPYKVFSRHGYGLAWLSERMEKIPHDLLIDAPADTWELGTRDAGSYVTFSEVVRYFEWLGSHFTDSTVKREQIDAAARAIHAHEKKLTDTMLHGTGNLQGLGQMEGVYIIGGVENASREGLVSLAVEGLDTQTLVEKLNQQGIRTHTRKADHYSGSVLKPLGLDSCVRVSLCHYNTEQEVAQFLATFAEIVSGS